MTGLHLFIGLVVLAAGAYVAGAFTIDCFNALGAATWGTRAFTRAELARVGINWDDTKEGFAVSDGEDTKTTWRAFNPRGRAPRKPPLPPRRSDGAIVGAVVQRMQPVTDTFSAVTAVAVQEPEPESPFDRAIQDTREQFAALRERYTAEFERVICA